MHANPSPIRLFPGRGAPHAPEGVAEAEQFVEDAYQVPVVPFPVVQVAAHEFGHVVEERLVPVRRLAGDQFEQRHEVVFGMAGDEIGKGSRMGGGGLKRSWMFGIGVVVERCGWRSGP